MPTEDLNFDCPFCLALISAPANPKASEAQCAACGRSVPVPAVGNVLASGDSDDLAADSAADLNQLLEVDDGSQGMLGEKGTFGLQCPTCDSRLLVGLRQVGEQIKCGDCFSMVKVRQPTSAELRQIEKQIALSEQDRLERGETEDRESRDWSDDGELQLAPLEELTEDEVIDDQTLLMAKLLSERDDSRDFPLLEDDDEEFGELKLQDLPEGFSDEEEETPIDADHVEREESKLAVVTPSRESRGR